MSLGLQHALAMDAEELLADHEEEQRKIEEQKRAAARRRASAPASALQPLDKTEHSEPKKESTDAPTTILPTTMRASKLDPHTSFQKRPRVDPDSDFSFGMTPATEDTVAQNTIAHRKSPSEGQNTMVRPKAMAAVYGKSRGRAPLPGDLGPGDPRRNLPGDLGPNDPRRGDIHSKSQSPSGRVPYRSTDKARRRRASEAALLQPEKSRGGSSNEKDDGRLTKDMDEGAVDSSEDEPDSDTSDRGSRGRNRGRQSARVGNAPDGPFDSEESDGDRGRSLRYGEPCDRSAFPKDVLMLPSGKSGSPRPPQSPNILVTPPNSDSYYHPRRSTVHPHSAYDHAGSAASSPRNSDDEEHREDVRRAQRLALTISPIHSTPSAHRVIRQVIRGDYAYFQHEAEEGRRRQRVYLVATDLSPEAEYALEWTIGTILRDGDTLLALYAVDEEGGTGASDGVEIGHGADVFKDSASIVGSLTAERVAQSPGPGSLGSLPRDASAARATAESGGATKAERERRQAASDISDRCVKLLRKTRLQIRVVVEIFHCKSPRHMITEVVSLAGLHISVMQ